MIKRFIKISAVVLVALTICTILSFSLISQSQGNDPLVTLSYLTEIILPKMKSDIVAEVTTSIETTVDDSANITTDISSGTYSIIELTNGQCLYANSAVEFIVRPGSDIRAISPFPAQGIADITKNVEYLNGDSVEINSYCVIPRGGDGRGIQVFNEKSYILVRGEYYIG